MALEQVIYNLEEVKGLSWPAPTIRYNTQLVTSESSFSEWPFLQPAANSDGVW